MKEAKKSLINAAHSDEHINSNLYRIGNFLCARTVDELWESCADLGKDGEKLVAEVVRLSNDKRIRELYKQEILQKMEQGTIDKNISAEELAKNTGLTIDEANEVMNNI